MNQDRRPLPRFWYLPRGLAAAVVMTGDDHANGGTAPRFNAFAAASPANCSVDNWECVRSTSYLYAGTPLTDAQAVAYSGQGFEVALHVTTDCADWTASSLEAFYATQLEQWAAQFPSLARPETNRTHCIAWSDYATQPQVALEHGIRLDTNFYYWPPGWVGNRPGFFTGSGLPMRFAQADGTLIDVYQATTQMTDESGQTYPFTIDALLDAATGGDGYYGVFTANMHLDGNAASYADADAIVASARARGVPVVSARQMLRWLDARNASSFGAIAWNGTELAFTITPGAGATGLTALVPVPGSAAVLAVTRDGSALPFSVSAIKGVKYAMFGATAGNYRVSFGVDSIRPRVTAVAPLADAVDVSGQAVVSAVFSEAMNPATIGTTTFELRSAAGALVPATVDYAALTQTATLVPAAPLAGGARFTATIRAAVTDVAGNALGADHVWSFTTTALASLWNSDAVPANADSFDANAVELGVKFRSDVAGSITAIRFYKGPNDNGSHTVSLWRTDGTLLARADAASASGSGWQTVALPSPVPIAANTLYVASYHSSAGRYPYDANYFTSGSRDSDVLHAPSSTAAGGNGVYVYGAGGFPSSTYNGTNYWVDVVLRPN